MDINATLSSLSAADKTGALFAINLENGRRATAAPIEDALPFATDEEIVDSYETILGASIAAQHASYSQLGADLASPIRQEFRTAFAAATLEKKEAAIAAGLVALA